MGATVRVPRIQAGDGDPRHGTSNGYGNLLCRCDACRHAWRVYQRNAPWKLAWRRRHHKPLAEYRAEIRARCGTRSGYKRHLAQGEPSCDACRKAERDYKRRTRRAAREAIAC